VNRQDLRSALIAAAVAALVAAQFAGAHAVESLRHVLAGNGAGIAAKSHAAARRGQRGRRGPTGAIGATGPTGSAVDPSTIRWRASSPFRKVTPADGAVRLVAECPLGTVAIDGGYLTGDAGGWIAVLGFERLTTAFDSREGYALTVRAISGDGGYPQVRAYCASN
jgi:hypothetical protein